MGCTVSKLDNDDTVRRSKERRRLMKEAVYARHHLAAAHFDYCRSLRLTGSALVAFAAGEPLSVSDHTPAVLLRTAAAKPPIFHPPPPPPPISTTSSHRYRKPPAPAPAPPRRRKPPIKLPHILSDSSFSSSPAPNLDFKTYEGRADSTYSTTPSQTSSVWNWDNFYPPPSPPDSEYFHNLQKSKKSESVVEKKGDNLKRWESEEEEEAEREEVHCSEWGDHDNYSSTSCSTDEDEDEEGDLDSRSDFYERPDFESSTKNEPSSGDVKMNANSKFSSVSEKLSSEDDAKSSASWGNQNSEKVDSDKRIVVRHRDLSEIVEALSEYFDKAASAGEQVSEMLEAGPAQLDQSFKQLRKTIYHSSGMLSNLSSSWTSKPPLAVKYLFEPSSIEQSGGSKSMCSTLERLLAWEKKLYQEVKAREGAKFEHEKRLSVLQSQEYRGEEGAKLDKTKASIKRLQSLMLVTSQAVSTTSFAIVGLRDSDLVPQLVDLCHSFMYMWRSMHQFHELQNNIVQQVKGLVSHSTKGENSTSDLHRQATHDLESAISTWHSSFCRLIKFKRDFIRSLHNWFKLTLIPINNEPTGGESSLAEVFAFFDEWKLVLDRVPDTVASEAIKSFNNVVRSISLKQSEEIKIKKRTETVSRELEKKASSVRSIEKKYYQSYSMVGIGLPEVGPENGHGLDARDPLAEKKAELMTWQRRVEDEMVRHSKAVEVTRAMTLNNIQTGLPGVFQAMTSFSALITEALETVCTRSYAI